MADYYSTEATALQTAGAVLDPGINGGDLKVYRHKLTLASQAKSKTVAFMTLPAGVTPLFFCHMTDTSLGSSKFSIGISGTAAKYRAEAAFTATGTPTFFCITTAQDKLDSAEEILMTLSADADLPSSGEYHLLAFCARH